MHALRLILFLLLGLLSAAARADDPSLAAALAIEQTFEDVIAQAESGVVSISRGDTAAETESRLPRGLFGGPRGAPSVELDQVPNFFGTGVVIGKDDAATKRYVLTNDHVLRGGRPDAPLPKNARFDVQLSNHRSVLARIVAADPRSDLAVLELQLAGSGIDPADVQPLKLGEASNVRKGQLVLAMGNPYAIARDGSASASWGIVSNISRRPATAEDADDETDIGNTIHQFGTLLHIDTRLDLGMSGGALLNLKGELIGLTTSLAALRGYEKSVGYAIPLDESMRRIIDDLLKGHEVEYGFLGINPLDAGPHDVRVKRAPREIVSAALANYVSFNSPADRAGLERDDLITRINDTPIHNAADLMREVGLLGPEGIARMQVWRRSERRQLLLTARLGKWPVQDDTRIIATQPRHQTWRGLQVDWPTARRRFQTSDVMEQYHEAVLVTGVADDSAAAAAGLRVGDFVTHVEDVPVETPAEFMQATAGLSGAATLVRLDGTRVELPPSAVDAE